MKKTYSFLAATLFFFSTYATNYPGNGNTGISGGTIGLGSLDITSTATDFTFKLNRGSGDFNDVLVVYIDSKGSGFPSTVNFTDGSNDLTKAISGFDGGSNRADFNFAPGFLPDFALAFKPIAGGKGKALLVRLSDNALFTVKDQPALSNNSTVSADNYEVTIKSSDISTPSAFKFVATYISVTGYRSNEAIGDPMTGFDQGWVAYTSTTEPPVYENTLPVVFGDFTGAFAGKNVQLTWETKSEINTKEYEVLKSNNGSSWASIGTLPSKNSNTGAVYTFTDNNVPESVSYYQIKQTDLDGSNSYSAVIIMRKDGISGITLLGNPARGTINLNISNTATATYRFELYSIDGRKVASQVYNHGGGSGKISIAVPGNNKGTFMLRISNGNETQTMKVIAE